MGDARTGIADQLHGGRSQSGGRLGIEQGPTSRWVGAGIRLPTEGDDLLEQGAGVRWGRPLPPRPDPSGTAWPGTLEDGDHVPRMLTKLTISPG